MTRHNKPTQCLTELTQEITDGGRSEYLEQEAKMGRTLELPAADCAIVAVVYAMYRPPSWQAYQDVMYELMVRINRATYQRRQIGESKVRFVMRRIKQHFVTPNRDPMHGTPNVSIAMYLGSFGYELTYTMKKDEWNCICDASSAYLVDMAFPDGGGHAVCVRNGTMYTSCEFDPEGVEVLNVLRLDLTSSEKSGAHLRNRAKSLTLQ